LPAVIFHKALEISHLSATGHM